MPKSTYWILAVLVGVSSYATVTRIISAEQRKKSAKALERNTPRETADYGFVGSSTCKACHPSAYASWHQSFHRTMTQYACPTSVRGNFDNVLLEYFGTTYNLERRGEEFWVRVGNESRRVVQTTGSHHYQMYWLATDHGNRLENFPFVYLLDEAKWVKRNDIFMVPPQVAARPEGARIWNQTCIRCHTTHGQPRFKGKVADTRVAEIGIGCESCHGPASVHVDNHSNLVGRYRARRTGSAIATMVNPEKLDSHRSADICGQCHSISSELDPAVWNNDGFSYRSGENLNATRAVLRHPSRKQQSQNQGISQRFLDQYFWSDGMVRVSGREYNGLIESPCFQRGELTCISCHSMHSSDPTDQLSNGMQTDLACVRCHTEQSEDLTKHTHHMAESSGSRCYNCHMPHTTYGLVKAIRSHEIDIPRIVTSLATGRPNACNLCHLDKSLDWTNLSLAEWYGHELVPLQRPEKAISASVRWLLAGDAGQRAIVAWHYAWPPAKEVSGDWWFAPLLAELLTDDYAVVRALAYKAIRALPKMEHVSYDYTDATTWNAGVDAVTTQWHKSRADFDPSLYRDVLLNDAGNIDFGKVFELKSQRDNKPVDLLE